MSWEWSAKNPLSQLTAKAGMSNPDFSNNKKLIEPEIYTAEAIKQILAFGLIHTAVIYPGYHCQMLHINALYTVCMQGLSSVYMHTALHCKWPLLPHQVCSNSH